MVTSKSLCASWKKSVVGMEFSKKWMIGNALVSLVLIIACAAGAQLTEITLAVLGGTTAYGGFYLWKAKNENRAKYAQKYMDKWAEKYGPEAAARIAEIVLKD